MFVVATQRFYDQFNAAVAPEQKKAVVADWNRTIGTAAAAVIHNFGPGKAQVRFVTGEQITGYKSLGGPEIAQEIPFERDALSQLSSGTPIYVREDKDVFRVAAALWSNVHPGCGACHVATVEGVGADLHKRILFGSLNVYVPLSEGMAQARAEALWNGLPVTGMFALLIAAVLFYITRRVLAVIQLASEDISETAGAIEAEATQVASASKELAQDTTEQAASLEETSAAAEQVNGMTNNTRENAARAAAIAQQSKTQLTRTTSVLGDMERAMSELNASSDKIHRIIRVIDEIAFQTNLLALNAAVEAARAGEAGMGFAVVADEVRNLAQRSAQAAKDTEALIEESIARTGSSTARLDELSEAVKVIVNEAAKTTALIGQIDAAAHEQSRGVTEISGAITRMSQLTQRSAARTEESASAALALSSHASHMRQASAKLHALFS
jgi:hypothetical protein